MTSPTTPKDHPLQLAEILSDLVSLRACPPAAALALVSAHRPPSHSQTTPATRTEETDTDKNLERAKELLRLHYEVKQAQKRGELSRGLEDARRGVERAVAG